MNTFKQTPLRAPDDVGATPVPLTPEVDPLDMPSGDIDTRFPRLQAGRLLTMVIRSPEKKVNDKQVEMIQFKLETTTEETDTDGKTLHPGFKFTHRIVGVSGERDIEAYKKDLAWLLKCVDGPQTKIKPRELVNNPDIIKDRLVNVLIGIQKEKDGFPETNTAKFKLPVS